MVITRIIISNCIKNYLPGMEDYKVAEMTEDVRKQYIQNNKRHIVELTKEYLKQKGLIEDDE